MQPNTTTLSDDTFYNMCKYALAAAAKSKCTKRKVGAILAIPGYRYFAECNQTFDDSPCEDAQGNTLPEVIHAEIAVITAAEAALRTSWTNVSKLSGYLFVTHPPCSNCQKAIDSHNLKVILVEQFMKFDEGKQRFDLLPQSVTHLMTDNTILPYVIGTHKTTSLEAKMYGLVTIAKYICYEAGISPQSVAATVQRVLEHGAKKYKPDNWRAVPDLTRYWNALGRHTLAMDNGEQFDADSGLTHAAHALCNITFLLELLPQQSVTCSQLGQSKTA